MVKSIQTNSLGDFMFTRKAYSIEGDHSISELFKLKIGGIDQWLYIRGEDKRKPVLLMLHGGPGAAQIGFARKMQKRLESHFVMVNWDQRGAGLSYAKDIPASTMNIRQFVEDTIEVSHYLLDRFNQDDLYLVGHSWGTVIGLLAVYKEPFLFKRYFGAAQLVNMMENEYISYESLLQKAERENNERALRDLKEIGKPPWSHLKHERMHQKYLERFGGGISRDGKLAAKVFKDMLLNGQYTLFDVVRHVKGQYFSLTRMRDEVAAINLQNIVDTIEIPIYFCMGKHDLTVPSQPTWDFYQNLEAKEKHWVWFEESAHSPLFEESDKFLDLVVTETQKDH